MRNARRRTAVMLTAVLGTWTVSGPAGPAVSAPPAVPGRAFLTGATDASYPLTADRGAWFVAATQGWLGGQSDVEVRAPDGSLLARAAEGFGVTDWVAVDTNPGRHPAGRYDVRVTADTDSGRPTTHLVQLSPGADLVPGQRTQVGDSGAPWLVDVRDLALVAGDLVSLRVGADVGAVYVLDDDPKPIFWQRTRATADIGVVSPKPDTDDETFDVTFTAPETGVYGIVFEARNTLSRAATVDPLIVG